MSIYQNKGAGFVHFSEEDETVDGVHSLSKNEQALSKIQSGYQHGI